MSYHPHFATPVRTATSAAQTKTEFLKRLSISQSLLLAVALSLLIGIFSLTYAVWAMRSAMLQEKASEIRHVVEAAGTIAKSFADRASAGDLSEDDAKAKAIEAIRAIKFDSSNYMFIFNFAADVVYHPRPDMQGKSMKDARDPAGVYFGRLIAEAGRQGGGFANYLWAKPGQSVATQKVTYVYAVPQWNWAIGAGHWVDDVDAVLLQLALDLAKIIIPVGIVVTTCLWLVVRNIRALLSGLTMSMKAVADGQLETNIDGTGRADDLGDMARALLTFRETALEKIKLEEDQRRERVQAEARAREMEAAAIASERGVVVTSLGFALRKLADRDLTYRMQDNLPEVYDVLQRDFNGAMEALAGAMGDVNGGVEMIDVTTSEIAAAADDLSRRTEQQAASLEETAAALEEITNTVKATAKNASETSDIVRKTKAEAETSAETVVRAVEAIGRIDRTSREISETISIVDEIAFQTNLLALNAGVEAARAGDQGRGFAVIATEVRALAQRCATAAKEIKALISNSLAEVKQGVDLVGQTGAELRTMVVHVQEIDQFVTQIAEGAREQSIGLTQVNIAVGEMDVTTQSNVAMVEETTAATHGLRAEIVRLTQAVAGFQLVVRDDPAPAARYKQAA